MKELNDFLSPEMYEQAAQKGDAVAQNYLGELYYNGNGVKKDIQKAEKWLRLAAEQNYADAQFLLGWINKERYNLREAIFWFKKAAANGHTKAKINWTVLTFLEYNLYRSNLFKNIEETLKPLANEGNVIAQCTLGLMYAYFNRDEEAFHYFQMAAESGESESQYFLAEMYYKGVAVAKNDRKAALWYERALNDGSQYCLEIQTRLKEMYYNGWGVKKNIWKGYEYNGMSINKEKTNDKILRLWEEHCCSI